jgi:hypothetical protein
MRSHTMLGSAFPIGARFTNMKSFEAVEFFRASHRKMIMHIITIGGVACPIKCAFGLEPGSIYSLRLQAKTNYSHLEQFIQQHCQFLGPPSSTA